MSGLFASRAARRRIGSYLAFLVASVLLMAISANPLIRDLQNGIAFAFKPIEVSIDGVAHDAASIGTALTEIDQLRKDNEALRNENDQLRVDNRSAAELRRENDQLTGLLQLRQGLTFKTIASAVIARETSEARRVIVIDRGSDDGVQIGHVVIAAGSALVGRVIDVGPSFARVLLLSDSTSIVIGQLLSSAATGKVVGGVAGALVGHSLLGHGLLGTAAGAVGGVVAGGAVDRTMSAPRRCYYR
jgi:rod shape-determining protein MreC